LFCFNFFCYFYFDLCRCHPPRNPNALILPCSELVFISLSFKRNVLGIYLFTLICIYCICSRFSTLSATLTIISLCLCEFSNIWLVCSKCLLTYCEICLSGWDRRSLSWNLFILFSFPPCSLRLEIFIKHFPCQQKCVTIYELFSRIFIRICIYLCVEDILL